MAELNPVTRRKQRVKGRGEWRLGVWAAGEAEAPGHSAAAPGLASRLPELQPLPYHAASSVLSAAVATGKVHRQTLWYVFRTCPTLSVT